MQYLMNVYPRSLPGGQRERETEEGKRGSDILALRRRGQGLDT